MRGLVNALPAGGAIWLLVLAAGVLTRTYWLAWLAVVPLACLAVLTVALALAWIMEAMEWSHR